MSEYWVACLEEILPDFGIELSDEKIKEFAEAVKNSADYLSEMSYYSTGGKKEVIDYESKYKKLYDEYQDLKYKHDCYRKSVARRHNCDVKDIYIDSDKVMISK